VIAGIDRQKDVAEQLRPFVEHVWNAFGPDRVVFGGDWPVCLLGGSYNQWVTALRQIAEGRSKPINENYFTIMPCVFIVSPDWRESNGIWLGNLDS